MTAESALEQADTNSRHFMKFADELSSLQLRTAKLEAQMQFLLIKSMDPRGIGFPAYKNQQEIDMVLQLDYLRNDLRDEFFEMAPPDQLEIRPFAMLPVQQDPQSNNALLPKRSLEKMRTEYNTLCVQHVLEERRLNRRIGMPSTKIYVETKTGASLLNQTGKTITVTDFPSKTQFIVPRTQSSVCNLEDHCLINPGDRATYLKKKARDTLKVANVATVHPRVEHPPVTRVRRHRIGEVDQQQQPSGKNPWIVAANRFAGTPYDPFSNRTWTNGYTTPWRWWWWRKKFRYELQLLTSIVTANLYSVCSECRSSG